MIVEQLPMFMDPRDIVRTAWPADVSEDFVRMEGLDKKPDAWAWVLEDKRGDFEWDYDDDFNLERVREPVHMWRRMKGQRSSHAPNDARSTYMLTDGHHRLAKALDDGEDMIPVVWVHHEKESSSLWGDEKYEYDERGDYRERNWLDAALIFRSTRPLKGS